MSHIDHRIGLTRDEILECLADERFHQLTNCGDQWVIAYRGDGDQYGQIIDADFDRLLERWGLLLAQWDESPGKGMTDIAMRMQDHAG